ncbi:unnamed protein product [Caenorhabditis brenneri]
MRVSILILCFCVLYCSCQSTSSSASVTSMSTDSVTTTQYSNSSPSSSVASSVSSTGATGSASSSGTPGGTMDSAFTTTSDSDSLNLNDVEKLVTYTTKQKTIFFACCGGTFVLLIALAILSGLSDTIARSRQKNTRTHA